MATYIIKDTIEEDETNEGKKQAQGLFYSGNNWHEDTFYNLDPEDLEEAPETTKLGNNCLKL